MEQGLEDQPPPIPSAAKNTIRAGPAIAGDRQSPGDRSMPGDRPVPDHPRDRERVASGPGDRGGTSPPGMWRRFRELLNGPGVGSGLPLKGQWPPGRVAEATLTAGGESADRERGGKTMSRWGWSLEHSD